MEKMNPLALQGNNIFNLKSTNEFKKDQTNIKIFKNSSFDSNFNSVQSLNTNLSQIILQPYPVPSAPISPPSRTGLPLCSEVLVGVANARVSLTRGSAILRAVRTIRLNRDEWKLIRYINLMEKKIRSSPLFAHPFYVSKAPSLLCASRERERERGATISSSTSSSNTNTKPLPPFPTPQLLAAPKWGSRCRLRDRQQSKGWNGSLPPLPLEKKPGYLKVAKEKKIIYILQNNKIFSYNKIINKNILLRNVKYNFLKSTLSSILKKKIRRISEILEDKPIKNYILYSYLKFCIFTPPHFYVPAFPPLHVLGSEVAGGVPTPPFKNLKCGSKAGGRTKLSLNKYKGRKFGSFINYNKIIGYKFNSTFYKAYPNSWAPFALPVLSFTPPLMENAYLNKEKERGLLRGGIIKNSPPLWEGGLEKNIGNIYIKDIYKLLFYLFKSMYCLISKPVLKYTNDKVTIQLFYYLNIPKKKVFRFFSISYINSFKKKWLAHIENNKNKFNYPSPLGTEQPFQSNNLPTSPFYVSKAPSLLCASRERERERGARAGGGSFPIPKPGNGNVNMPRGNTKIYIRWKLRKAISRFKIKNTLSFGGGGMVNNLLFKLRKYNLTAKAVYQNKFKLICAILSNKFNKPVELQLIRLHHPYHDSNILVNLLSLNIKNKRKKARVAIQKIYNNKPIKFLNDPNLKNPALPTTESLFGGTGNFIPAFLSGLNIKIAGRLMGEPIIPRITTKVFGKGASATGKVNYLDVARITKKNRKGAYTIKITSGQNFF